MKNKENLLIVSRNDAKINADLEIKRIKTVLEQSTFGRRFEILSPPAVSPSELITHIRKFEPTMIHFIGHGDIGDDGPILQLSNAEGARQDLHLRHLRDYLVGLIERERRPKLSCVFLNACYVGAWADQLLDCAEVVIGTDTQVMDRVAQAFAGKFYEHLGLGIGFEASFHDAVHATAAEADFERFRIQVAPTISKRGSPRLEAVGGEVGQPPWANACDRDQYGKWATFLVAAVEQRMRWIEPGGFMMGSPINEVGRFEREGPQHDVTMSRGYWLAEAPCTQDLWVTVMGTNPSRFQSPTRPVEQVSWADVQLFLQRLGVQVSQLKPRLPSEAQWEYACRAGTSNATHADGRDIRGAYDSPSLDGIAWYAGNSGVGWDLAQGHDSSNWPAKQHEHTRAGTREIKAKQPNAWGLYDMLGNVFEWCCDGGRTYSSASISDPLGPQGRNRVIRGGCWQSQVRDVRSACRHWHGTDLRTSFLGFRLMLAG